MKQTTPTAKGGRGCETLGGGFSTPSNIPARQTQFLTAHFNLAATIAPHAFGEAHHG